MSTATSDLVSDLEMTQYSKLIYERTGIRIPPQKKTLLSNRLRRRLRETGLANFSLYMQDLQRRPSTDPEWDAFLQEITTHESYLFRDQSQWEWFRGGYLPELDAAAREGKRPRQLRIWSAACSTGDEVYTIAACVSVALANLSAWRVKVLGTDIGVGSLEAARNANFNERAMRQVPLEIRRRCFREADNVRGWQPKPSLSAMVEFQQHNLLEPLKQKPFDLVFVKNVLIYFDAASKRTVLGNIREVVAPGGAIVVGAAEGVSDLLRDFERIQPWLFRRPAGA